MTIMVDYHEPEQIEHLVAQTVPVIRCGLNDEGFADYLWFACDGHRIQVERKQIDEILGGLDKVEEQLRRELSNGVEETILLHERECEPIHSMKMFTQSWNKTKDGKIMVPGHKYNVSYTGLHAWFNQLDKAGITIVHSFDYEATALVLVALYQNSQKVEHTTLRRYIKEHIYIKDYNPHVLNLMSIKGAGIGEAKATALIQRFGTFWYTINQPVESLAETLVGEEGKEKRFGMVGANRLLKAIGKNV